MILRFIKNSTSALIVAMSLNGSVVLSETNMSHGDHITALGVVTSVDENGFFTIDSSEYRFRLYGIEIHDDIPPNEFVGQRITCRSMFSLQEIRASGFSEELIAARCRFYSLFLRDDVGDALKNVGLAHRVCDPQAPFPKLCPFPTPE